MLKNILIALLVIVSVAVQGQEPAGSYYWIQFNSKNNSIYSIEKPEVFLSQRAIERRTKQGIEIDSTDFPVNAVYTDSLKSLGFYVKNTSKWMNGALVILNSKSIIDSIKMPSFVSAYELRKDGQLKSSSNKFSDIDSTYISKYGNSLKQISMLNGHLLHNASKGKGVHIAVIDAGFMNANKLEAFDSLFARNGVLGTFDFVKPGNNVYNEYYHGNAVLSIMAGNVPGKLIGSAPESSYWLLRTEDVASESPVEEDYWIIAAEFADSVGCDVINTSLGYTTFDNPSFNHTYEQFNGKTLRISKAANMAVDKGMVLVCSAGNSGTDSWRHIVAPSEAEKVLSVSALNSEGKVVDFSSRGFSGDGFLPKPDISAMGAGVTYATTTGEYTTGNGTSFSSPIIAGMAACLVAYFPEKTSIEIIQLIRELGSTFPLHDLAYGYGIPDFSKIIQSNPSGIHSTSAHLTTIYPNPFQHFFQIKNLSGFKNIEFYSSTGQQIFTDNGLENRTEFYSPSLSNLKKGVYFAVLKGDHKVESFKLIKY